MAAMWTAEYVCDWHPKWGWTPSTCKHYWHEPVATEIATSTCPNCGATRSPWKTTPIEGMN